MCGLLYSNDRSVSKEMFLTALGLMEHRGPDAAANYGESQEHKLGHNRLKILDLDDRSNQPFWSRDKRYVIIYNGEIYNYRELADNYRLDLQTTSDTEVILKLYLLLGPKVLNMLNGMFAFIILDTQTGQLFVARDRLGVKPLYISRSKGRLTIASEIAPVIELTGNDGFDVIGIRQYRKLRAFFNGRTAYQGI